MQTVLSMLKTGIEARGDDTVVTANILFPADI